MKKILVLKTLFCPNQEYFDINFNTIMSLSEFFSENKINAKYNIHLLIIGWCKLTEQRKLIDKLVSKYSVYQNIDCLYFNINYGKYFYLKIIDKYYDEHDFVMCVDHDIFFDDASMKLFDNISKVFSTVSDIGIVALNHQEDNRHQLSMLQKYTEIDDQTYLYSDIKGSIAFGCFFIKDVCVDILKEIPLRSVYGFDEVIIQKKFLTKGYVTVLADAMYVIHPFDKNLSYKLWKIQIVKKIIDCHNSNVFDYNTSLESSINFWNNFTSS